MVNGSIPIEEMVLTIMGEGPLVGTPCLLIRTGGCDRICVWCDAGYNHSERFTNKKYIWWDVGELSEFLYKEYAGIVENILITGGEPLIHEQSLRLLYLTLRRFDVCCETHRTDYTISTWFDTVIMSPKLLSAGTPDKINFHVAEDYANVHLKFVIKDRTDLIYLMNELAKSKVLPINPIWLQPVDNSPEALQAIYDCGILFQTAIPFKLSLQTHKFINLL